MRESALHMQMGLASGGGIDLEGSRVDPVKGKAFLFVGLGGTGADALLRIKKQIYTRMKLPRDGDGMIMADTPDTVGFLEIDAEESIRAKAYGPVHFDPHSSDFQSIYVHNLAGVIAKSCCMIGKTIRSWHGLTRVCSTLPLLGRPAASGRSDGLFCS